MEINVVKTSDVQLVKNIRKARVSKYDLVCQELLKVQVGECLVVGTSENQTPESLKQNLYQALKNKFEGRKLSIKVLLDQSGVAIHVK